MKPIIQSVLILLISIASSDCWAQKSRVFKSKEVYKSKYLVVIQVAENSFKHTSFKQTHDFGNVPCNGLVVRSNNEVIVFDTPSDGKSSEELIKWTREKLQCKINAVVPTHFHDDCLGGLKAFHKNDVPSYAYFKTIELAKENNLIVPQNGFRDSLVLKVGNKNATVHFFGEGHTKDNIVGYFSNDNILFGGCLIKELKASKGYLGDATIADWPTTVEKIKMKYKNVEIIVPGHGAHGDKKLLDYTIQLFKTQ